MSLYGEVRHTEALTPSIIRVVLGGSGLDEFEPMSYTDQYVNALFLPDGSPFTVPFDVEAARSAPEPQRPRGRRYTVRRWDPDRREFTVDFVVHGDVGYAGPWAADARPDDRLQFTGPGGSYRPDPQAAWQLMVGDESALPAIGASLEAVAPGQATIAVVLVDDVDCEITLDSPGDLDLRWVHRSTDPTNEDLLLGTVEGLAFPPGEPQVFVHGEAAEVRSIRRHLLAERGVAKDRASISPYWRRDHTDEQWRQIKKDWLAASDRDIA